MKRSTADPSVDPPGQVTPDHPCPVPFGIDVIELILVLTDTQRRRLGDKFANTVVVEVEA